MSSLSDKYKIKKDETSNMQTKQHILQLMRRYKTVNNLQEKIELLNEIIKIYEEQSLGEYDPGARAYEHFKSELSRLNAGAQKIAREIPKREEGLEKGLDI